MATITQQLGFNRDSNIFAVGEDVQLHVAYVAGPTSTWTLNKDGKAAKPDERERIAPANAASPTALKFKFKDGKTSDTGVYVFEVTDGSVKKTSTFELLCKSSAPQIKLPAKFTIYDTTKPVTLKLGVTGIVDEYNWVFRDEALDSSNFQFASDLYPDTNAKSFTIADATPRNLSTVYCQAINNYTGVADENMPFSDAHIYTGIFGKPAGDIKLIGKLPARIIASSGGLLGTLRFNISAKNPLPLSGGITIVAVKDGGTNFGALPLPSRAPSPMGAGYSIEVDVDFGEFPFSPGYIISLYVAFRATSQVLHVGDVEVAGPPVVSVAFPPGAAPTVIKAGSELRASIADSRGSKPITIFWHYTTDAGRSWREVGKGEQLIFRPTISGTLSCIASNAHGSSAAQVRAVTVSASGNDPKKPGQR